MAKKTYTIATVEAPAPQAEPDVRHQQITVSQNVKQESSFTLADLENQIEQCNQQIASAEGRKTELEAQIAEAKTALGIE